MLANMDDIPKDGVTFAQKESWVPEVEITNTTNT